MEVRGPCFPKVALVFTWYFMKHPTLAPQLEKTHETPPSSRDEGLLFAGLKVTVQGVGGFSPPPFFVVFLVCLLIRGCFCSPTAFLSWCLAVAGRGNDPPRLLVLSCGAEQWTLGFSLRPSCYGLLVLLAWLSHDLGTLPDLYFFCLV